MSVTLTHLRLVASSFLSCFRLNDVCHTNDLLKVEQVPDILKEPYIYSGYRPVGRSWKFYFYSCLNLHNESINVWTHAGGFFLILVRLLEHFRGVDVLNDKSAWPVVGFGLGALLNLVLSAGAHLLHSKSRWHHYVFFLLDYMGVTFYAFGTGIGSMFSTSGQSYHDAMLEWFLPANVIVAWFAFYACCRAKISLAHDNTKRKTLMLAGVGFQGVFIALPTLSRYWECLFNPSCSFSSLNHITIVFFLVIMCGVTFAGHVPESWMPGCFDIFGHGHQIFHILAVVNMLAQIRAINIDINVLNNATNLQPDLKNICLSFVALLILEVLTLIYYMQFIVFRRLSQEIPREDVKNSLRGLRVPVGKKEETVIVNGKREKSS